MMSASIEVDDNTIAAEMWEIAENLHKLDLTKEQRDEHIRRYADLIEARELQSRQSDVIESKRDDGRGHRPEGTATKIARETGLSKSTVERALRTQPILVKSALEPESEEDATIREANVIVGAWNRARLRETKSVRAVPGAQPSRQRRLQSEDGRVGRRVAAPSRRPHRCESPHLRHVSCSPRATRAQRERQPVVLIVRHRATSARYLGEQASLAREARWLITSSSVRFRDKLTRNLGLA